MSILLWMVIGLIVLQFVDALMSYPVFNNSIKVAGHELQWLAGKIGVIPALVTTKVVVVAVIVALYLLTTLPLWLWIAAIVYYLYRTGKWAFIYYLFKKYVYD